jgi:hypothetical protein
MIEAVDATGVMGDLETLFEGKQMERDFIFEVSKRAVCWVSGVGATGVSGEKSRQV